MRVASNNDGIVLQHKHQYVCIDVSALGVSGVGKTKVLLQV